MASGRQIMSWVALDDVVGAVHHALQDEGLWGPVNVTAPQPVTNRVFARTLGGVLGRPQSCRRRPSPCAWSWVARWPRRRPSQAPCVLPERLQASGYPFRYRELEPRCATCSDVIGREIEQ